MFSIAMLPLALLAALPLSPVWAAPYCQLQSPQDASGGQSPLGSGPASSSPSSGGSGSGSGGSGSGGSSAPSGDAISMTWYAGWHGQYLPVSNVSWTKYDVVTYAFATTTPDVTQLSLAASDEELLPQFVQYAHQNNVKAMLTVGGWSGSQYFSTAVATDTNRTQFAQTVLSLVSQYNLDGIDFDWEYPGRQGMGCNTISGSDSANFLSFLQTLRAEPAAKNLTLSAAVGLTPFASSSGSPMTDVSAFASVLDFVEVMNYDVWGMWSAGGVGPNAPLNDTCAPAADQQGSAVSAVKAWTAAGFPADQIVLGVASYGHSFLVEEAQALVSPGSDALAAYPAYNTTYQPQGDSWDVYSPGGPGQCGGTSAGGYDGIWDFWGLVQGGYLTNNGSVASGIGYRYDSCSQTPYVYDPSTQVMVSFDNAESFAAKGQYIKNEGLKGFAMWEAAGDYNDILLDAINGAM